MGNNYHYSTNALFLGVFDSNVIGKKTISLYLFVNEEHSNFTANIFLMSEFVDGFADDKNQETSKNHFMLC